MHDCPLSLMRSAILLVYFVRLIGQKRSMFPSFLIYFPNVTTQVARESSRYFIETVYHPPPSQKKEQLHFTATSSAAATETVVVAVNVEATLENNQFTAFSDVN